MVDKVSRQIRNDTQYPITLIVDVEIKPDRLDDFLKAITVDTEGSRQEDGCYRFDLLRDGDSNRFTFYESYKDEDAI